MKILAEISEESLGLEGGPERFDTPYVLRKSARVILLNDEGKMAVQYLRTYSLHKLPGGGIEAGETPEVALKREVLEEVGCECEIVRPIGVTIQYMNRNNLLHIAYCYEARVVGDIGAPELDEGEIEEGQVTEWLDPAETLEKMLTDVSEKPEAPFILKRESTFVAEYLKTL